MEEIVYKTIIQTSQSCCNCFHLSSFYDPAYKVTNQTWFSALFAELLILILPILIPSTREIHPASASACKLLGCGRTVCLQVVYILCFAFHVPSFKAWRFGSSICCSVWPFRATLPCAWCQERCRSV